MTVRAPFRPAAINKKVFFPEWGPLVSHDIPFTDGLCGEMSLEIEAMTPLLVGGPRRRARTATEAPPNGREGEVTPYRSADGTYAIPGSTIQGMVRTILEVAGLGQLGPFVADRRFGMRDLRSPTGKALYQTRMTTRSTSSNLVSQHVLAGWLVRTAGGGAVIFPCKFARIGFPEIRALKASIATSPLDFRNDAAVRYGWFMGTPGACSSLDRTVHLEPRTLHLHSRRTIEIAYQLAYATPRPGSTGVNGTLVFTGKPQQGVGSGHKKLEFVFHTPNRAAALSATATIDVPADVWRDFKVIHSAQPGRDENPNWRFWRPEFEAGRPVPIFYLEEGGRLTTMGTAFMFKTAMPLSTHDMLRNSCPDHCPGADDRRRDLPSLIFGEVANDLGERGLKRRASFDLARRVGVPNGPLFTIERAILLEPKPSFYPNYVRQPKGSHSGALDNPGLPMAIYQAASSGVPERVKPELAGVKLWPSRGRVMAQGHPPISRTSGAFRSRCARCQSPRGFVLFCASTIYGRPNSAPCCGR